MGFGFFKTNSFFTETGWMTVAAVASALVM